METTGKSGLPAAPHRLVLDERRDLTVSGVEEVVAFDEGQVSVRTVKGLLQVRGDNLRVERLEKTTGEMHITGLVTELDYEETEGAAGLWGRLFRG